MIIIIGREREQNRIFCDAERRTEEEEEDRGIGHSSKWMLGLSGTSSYTIFVYLCICICVFGQVHSLQRQWA